MITVDVLSSVDLNRKHEQTSMAAPPPTKRLKLTPDDNKGKHVQVAAGAVAKKTAKNLPSSVSGDIGNTWYTNFAGALATLDLCLSQNHVVSPLYHLRHLIVLARYPFDLTPKHAAMTDVQARAARQASLDMLRSVALTNGPESLFRALPQHAADPLFAPLASITSRWLGLPVKVDDAAYDEDRDDIDNWEPIHQESDKLAEAPDLWAWFKSLVEIDEAVPVGGWDLLGAFVEIWEMEAAERQKQGRWGASPSLLRQFKPSPGSVNRVVPDSVWFTILKPWETRKKGKKITVNVLGDKEQDGWMSIDEKKDVAIRLLCQLGRLAVVDRLKASESLDAVYKIVEDFAHAPYIDFLDRLVLADPDSLFTIKLCSKLIQGSCHKPVVDPTNLAVASVVSPRRSPSNRTASLASFSQGSQMTDQESELAKEKDVKISKAFYLPAEKVFWSQLIKGIPTAFPNPVAAASEGPFATQNGASRSKASSEPSSQEKRQALERVQTTRIALVEALQARLEPRDESTEVDFFGTAGKASKSKRWEFADVDSVKYANVERGTSGGKVREYMDRVEKKCVF